MKPKRLETRGRKPRGEITGKAAAFTTRITPDTKAALERIAKAHKRSVSQETEMILREALGAPNAMADKAMGPAHIRALMMAFAAVAQEIEADTGLSWREDRYTFEALEMACRTLLDQLAPTGEIKFPKRLRELEKIRRHDRVCDGGVDPDDSDKFDDPKNVGFDRAARFFFRLTTIGTPPAWIAGLKNAPEYPTEAYRFSRWRRELGIKIPIQRKPERSGSANEPDQELRKHQAAQRADIRARLKAQGKLR